MVTIYHSPLSRSVRVLWLAEEIGLAYQLETVEMFSVCAKKIRIEVPFEDLRDISKWMSGWIEIVGENP